MVMESTYVGPSYLITDESVMSFVDLLTLNKICKHNISYATALPASIEEELSTPRIREFYPLH